MPYTLMVATETGTATAMSTVIEAMSDVFNLVGTVVTQITSQPILLFCLAAGMVPIGISIFTRLKNASRG